MSDEPLVVVARAVRTRGLKGELVADLLTDFPERFDRVSRLICLNENLDRTNVELEGHWFQKERIILKLVGVDNPETASRYVGCEFAVPESERVQLPADEFYDWELQGCEVKTIGGLRIGHVREILRTGGVDTMVVESEDSTDYLVPMAEAIVVSIDAEKKEISIDPPEGLLEL